MENKSGKINKGINNKVIVSSMYAFAFHMQDYYIK
jgi:hypothetical protein